MSAGDTAYVTVKAIGFNGTGAKDVDVTISSSGGGLGTTFSGSLIN